MLGIYGLCGVVGFLWVAGGLLAGQVGGDAGHGDVHDGGGDVSLPLFSPTAIAGYLMGFGATGFGLVRGLGVTNPLVHVPVSVIGAGLLGVTVAWTTVRLLQMGETDSTASLRALAGIRGELTVGIPDDGLGEVAFEAGARRTSPARCLSGPLPRGAQVRIVRADADVVLVEPAPPENPPRGEPV